VGGGELRLATVPTLWGQTVERHHLHSRCGTSQPLSMCLSVCDLVLAAICTVVIASMSLSLCFSLCAVRYRQTLQ
jgi:hypothetical protein